MIFAIGLEKSDGFLNKILSFKVALTDAIVEPIANSIWYFILDKWWTSKSKK